MEVTGAPVVCFEAEQKAFSALTTSSDAAHASEYWENYAGEATLQNNGSQKASKKANGDSPTVMGKNIRLCLNYLAWGMKDLADASGVSLRTISAWTNCPERKPTLSYAKQLAEALGKAMGLVISHRDLLSADFDINKLPRR